MIRFSFKVLLILLFMSCERAGDNNCETLVVSDDIGNSSKYDSLYAERIGADDYGMKQYVMAFLKAGPNRAQSKEEAEELQRAHLDNITRMADEGMLVMAGPFLDDTELKGIYIFNVKTIDVACYCMAVIREGPYNFI